MVIHPEGRLLSSNISELTRRPVTLNGTVGDVMRDLSRKIEGSCAETQISQAGDFLALWRAPVDIDRARATGQSATGGGS